jgi:hypothetical protein
MLSFLLSVLWFHSYKLADANAIFLHTERLRDHVAKSKRDCKKIDATTPMFTWTIVAKKIYWKPSWNFLFPFKSRLCKHRKKTGEHHLHLFLKSWTVQWTLNSTHIQTNPTNLPQATDCPQQTKETYHSCNTHVNGMLSQEKLVSQKRNSW